MTHWVLCGQVDKDISLMLPSIAVSETRGGGGGDASHIPVWVGGGGGGGGVGPILQ